MPEGDTVHTLAGALRPRLEGRRLAAVRLSDGTCIANATVVSVQALGKHLLFALSDGRTLRSHLGMHGSWHSYPHGAPWRKPAYRASIVLETRDEILVCFDAHAVELVRRGGLRDREFRARIGPDLATGAVDTSAIRRRADALAAWDAPLIDILLDQRIAAGIGNVYKSETLYLLRLYPLRPLASLAESQFDAMFAKGAELLRQNLRGGPRVTRTEGSMKDGLWVYRRKGRACLRCATPISMERLGKGLRSTYWCPECQPPSPAGESSR